MKKKELFDKTLLVETVKDNFRTNLKPCIGEIVTKEKKPNTHESMVVNFLFRVIGGSFIFLKESRRATQADVLWSGQSLEIKKASGKSSISNRLRKGIKQVGNSGIILLDVTDNQKTLIEIRKDIIHYTRRNVLEYKQNLFRLDIIIFKSNKIKDILRFKSKREE